MHGGCRVTLQIHFRFSEVNPFDCASMNNEKSTLSINEQFVAYLFSVLELQNGYSSLFILYILYRIQRDGHASCVAWLFPL